MVKTSSDSFPYLAGPYCGAMILTKGCLHLVQRKKWIQTMNNTKFIVKVDRGNTHAPEYVQRIDRTPIETTPNPKLALVMGRYTAEDAVKSLQNSRCSPELVSVQFLP